MKLNEIDRNGLQLPAFSLSDLNGVLAFQLRMAERENDKSVSANGEPMGVFRRQCTATHMANAITTLALSKSAVFI